MPESESLFQQMKRIGIDEELAHQVSASLDPDYIASKKDVLVMQEAILRTQMKSEESFKELHREITDVRAEMRADMAAVRSEISDVRAEMRADMAELRSEISDVRSEMRTQISDVQKKMVDVRSELLTEIHTTINRQ